MTFTNIRFRLANVSILSWLLVLSILALITTFILWWFVVYQSPSNVFNGMIKNNFATTGYTRHVISNENGLEADELTQVQSGGKNIVRTKTTLKQGGDTVTTDAISSDSAEYVRYINIDTNRKDQNGKQMDFSKAVNVWGKSETNGPSQNFSQMLFGTIPMGNATPEVREELIKFIDKHTVFSVNYDSVKTEKVNGRKAYVYEVQLLPQTYVEMLKLYGKGVGLGEQVAQLDPSKYAEAQPTDLRLTVDVASRRLVSLEFPGNANRKETYSSYGIVQDVELPKKTISTEELQRRLSTQ